MKKISALLLFLLTVSFAYAQPVEMSTVIPVTPSAVVDELRVIGSNTNSNVNVMNIGVVGSGEDTPYQSQTLNVTGTTSITSSITAGRDLFVREPLSLSALNIGNGNVFTNATSFPKVNGGTFRAKTIQLAAQAASTSAKVNKLSGGAVQAVGAVVDDPFEKGTTIAKRKAVYVAKEESTTAAQDKYHIYRPWGTPQATQPTGLTKCNNASDFAICTKNTCPACTSGGNTTCYDVRKRDLPAVYDAAGAVYEKMGTAKFYCRPSDTVDANGDVTSECRHYMVYSSRNSTSLNPAFRELFTTDAVNNPFNNIVTTNVIDGTASPAEKCAAMCSTAGCTGAQAGDYFVAIDTATLARVNFTSVYNETCQNANSAWPAGSGLNCKAQEKVIDIYVLRCNEGSGHLARAAGTYYQTRQVLCKKYDKVHGNEAANVSSINNKYFFYPEFALSMTAAYDTATLQNLGYVSHNDLVAH